MAIKLGILGAGAFAQCFIPLYKAHPLVSAVTLCDRNAEKLKASAEKHGIAKCTTSYDELLASDVDAIVIITQHWLHAPQAIQALKAGKHVYSAVPSAVSMDEIGQLVETVAKQRRVYMVGETSY